MIHLITYGDHIYERAKIRLCIQAANIGWFDTITGYGPADLDDSFKEKFKDILEKRRGGGYWIWKPHVIQKKLNEINENDILIYLDAGCIINTKGKNRFEEYIELLNNANTSSIISFQMIHKEKYWTTKEIFQYFNVESNRDITDSGQILGGIIILKKNSNSVKLINTWNETLYKSPSLFTDDNNNNQEDYFKDNRHDQSIFSVIRKMNNPILLNEETYFRPFGNEESLK